MLFPLANKSYVSMSKMKKLQPEMQRIKERFGDDRMRQQQAMMELYKKEKVNPASGCLPILVQIPVFFALYKVLFVTIEMRHAPFFGWIKDLSAPDPTIRLQPVRAAALRSRHGAGHRAFPHDRRLAADHGRHHVGADEAEPGAARSGAGEDVRLDAGVLHLPAGGFPAGLVIYWAWNNTLSVIQQSVIMTRQGVEIPLLENLGIKKKPTKTRQGREQGVSVHFARVSEASWPGLSARPRHQSRLPARCGGKPEHAAVR